MNYLESGGFCPIDEYARWENERVLNPGLQVDELYILMASLKSRDPQTQAVQKPARVLKLIEGRNGLTGVRLDILDNDLQSEFTTGALFRDGYWIDITRQVAFATILSESGYFRDYGDMLDWGLWDITESLDMNSSGM